MKKSLIALSVFGAFAGAAQAQSSVTLYGIADANLQFANNGSQSITKVQSGGVLTSRFGLKGSEDLGGNLKALFTLESGFNIDDGTSRGTGPTTAKPNNGGLFDRAAWVGLNGGFGTVSVGRQLNPLFTLQNDITFNKGGMAWGNATNYFSTGYSLKSRLNNSLAYSTNNLSGFTGTLMYSAGESPVAPKSLNNVFAGRVSYANGPLLASLAYESSKATATATQKTTALGASYDLGVVKLGGMFTNFKADGSADDSRVYEIYGYVPLGGGNLLLDYGKIKDKTNDTKSAKAFSVRYDYSLSKRTFAYVGFAKVKNEGAAVYAPVGAGEGNALTPAVAGQDPRAFLVGVSHAF